MFGQDSSTVDVWSEGDRINPPVPGMTGLIHPITKNRRAGEYWLYINKIPGFIMQEFHELNRVEQGSIIDFLKSLWRLGSKG